MTPLLDRTPDQLVAWLTEHGQPRMRAGQIRRWLIENCAAERKAGDSEQQFLYKSRKKAIGPFKRDMWHMGPDVLASISADLEARFGFLFDQLNIQGTAEPVGRYVTSPVMRHAVPRPVGAAAPDDAEAGE